MTDIEQKALELWNAERAQEGLPPIYLVPHPHSGSCFAAICRAIEAHDADKSRHAAELREQAERFSEALEKWQHIINRNNPGLKAMFADHFSPFILAPVDPLVEALVHAYGKMGEGYDNRRAELVRAALEARGLAIVKKEAVNG